MYYKFIKYITTYNIQMSSIFSWLFSRTAKTDVATVVVPQPTVTTSAAVECSVNQIVIKNVPLTQLVPITDSDIKETTTDTQSDVVENNCRITEAHTVFVEESHQVNKEEMFERDCLPSNMCGEIGDGKQLTFHDHAGQSLKRSAEESVTFNALCNKTKRSKHYLDAQKNQHVTILLTGPKGCGKSAYATRLTTADFIEEHYPTLFLETYHPVFYTNLGKIQIDFQEQPEHKITNKKIMKGYIEDIQERATKGVIVMFDITLGINEFKKACNICDKIPNSVKTILCGNKHDLRFTNLQTMNEMNDEIHKYITESEELGKNIEYIPLSVAANYNYEKPILSLLRNIFNDDCLTFVENWELPEYNQEHVTDNSSDDEE
jgi:GTPase SAR1 family protein